MKTTKFIFAVLFIATLMVIEQAQSQSLSSGNAYDKKLSISSNVTSYNLVTNDTVPFYTKGQSVSFTLRSLSATKDIKVPEIYLSDTSSFKITKSITDTLLKRPKGHMVFTVTFKDSVLNKIAKLNFKEGDATNLASLSGIVLASKIRPKGCKTLFVDSAQNITSGVFDLYNCSNSKITVSGNVISGSGNISLSIVNWEIGPQMHSSYPFIYNGKLGRKDEALFQLTAVGDSITPFSKTITLVGESVLSASCQNNKSFHIGLTGDKTTKGLLIKEGATTPNVKLLASKNTSLASNSSVGDNTYYIDLGVNESYIINKIGTNDLKPNTQYSIAVIGYGASFDLVNVARGEMKTNPEILFLEPTTGSFATTETNDAGTLLKITQGNGNYRLLLIKKSVAPNISGLVDGRAVFSPSDGSSIAYLNQSLEATISNLLPNTTYHGKLVELNSNLNLNNTCDLYFNYNKTTAFSFSFKTTTSQNVSSNGSGSTPDPTVNSLTTSGAVTLSNDTILKNVTLNKGAVLVINSGKTLTVNGNLVLEDGASIIDNGTVDVLTNITVKRNGTKSAGIYNYWSSPVVNGQLSKLGGNTYTYNESGRLIGDYSSGWATATGAMTVGVGYTATGTGTASFSGTLNTGTISRPVTRTTIDNSINDGWNLLGNPYPSELNLVKFLDTNTVLVNGAYYWNGSNYITSNSGNIPSCQGFFVQALNSGSVVFTNKMRMGGSTALYRLADQESAIIPIEDGLGNVDQTQIDLNDLATDGYDARYDAAKLKGNTKLQLYSKIGKDEFAINSLMFPAYGKTIPLGLDAIAGTYTFGKVTAQLDGSEVYLNDKLTNKSVNLNIESYQFTTPAVIGSDRFSISLGIALVTGLNTNTGVNTAAIYLSNDQLFVTNMPYGTTVVLYDTKGTQIMSGITSDLGMNVAGLKAGIYIAKANDSNTSVISKIIVQ